MLYYCNLSEFKDHTFDSFLGFDLAEGEKKEDNPLGANSYVEHLAGSGRTLYCWVSKKRLFEKFEKIIKPYLSSIYVDAEDLLFCEKQYNHYGNFDFDNLICILHGMCFMSEYKDYINKNKICDYIEKLNYFNKTGYTVSACGLKFRIDKSQYNQYIELMKTDTVTELFDYKNYSVGVVRTSNIECILDNKMIQSQ